MKKSRLFVLLSSIVLSICSCSMKASNKNKVASIILPSGAPTLAAHSIIENDNYDTKILNDATLIPAEFNLGNSSFIVFDSVKGLDIIKKQGENAKYEYVSMLTGGNFKLLGFNQKRFRVTEESVVYGFMSNSTPGQLFKNIYGDRNFDQNFDSVGQLKDTLLTMNSECEVNGVRVDYALIAEPAATIITNPLVDKGIIVTSLNLQIKFNNVNDSWNHKYICQAGLFVNKEFKNTNVVTYNQFIVDLNNGKNRLFNELDIVVSEFSNKYLSDNEFINKYGFSHNVINGVQGNNSSKNGFGIVPTSEIITEEEIVEFSNLLSK